ncbi:hypothetical protein GH714_010114 [Hevea brasiliensis]|uniref:U-box domain-containing protein n=1 Tax=Hevea brasiliensis TaxID=3981 RepID=A0A6A6KTY2_HEVBR|nr:hypothetical protein GH714_010114 [Hevea brasiliensis]
MKEAQMSIPHLFICPISLDLFKDPVTLCTGQTYDRSSIEKWLSAGNLTCPVIMQKLHDLSMVPNHTLRHLIDDWLQMGPQFDPDYKKTIDSLSLLKSNLASHEATLEKKFQALERIQALSEESTSRISVSDHEGSESAVRSLVLICSDSLQAREQAICVGVLTQLLLLLQSQCSGRTKSKARMLLKKQSGKDAAPRKSSHMPNTNLGSMGLVEEGIALVEEDITFLAAKRKDFDAMRAKFYMDKTSSHLK